MSNLILWLDHLSQPARAVHLLLLENKIPVELKTVSIGKGEPRSDAFKAINPNGKVPCLSDNGFVLWESHAMLRYLVQTRNLPDHWYPKDAKPRALVDRYLDWHHSNTRVGCAGLFQAKFLLPLFGVPAEKLVNKEKNSAKVVKATFQFIEQVFLADTPFLAGSEITIADLSAAQEIIQLHIIAFDFSPYPKLVEWLNRVEKRCTQWSVSNAAVNKVIAKNRPKYLAAASSTSSSSSDKKKEKASAVSANSTSATQQVWSESANKLISSKVFSEIKSQLPVEGPEIVKKLGSIFRFNITGAKDVKATFYIDLKNGSGDVWEGDRDGVKADTTFILTDDNFINLAVGKVNPQVAFLSGKLKLQGNLAKAMTFNTSVFQKPSIKTKIVEAVKKIQAGEKIPSKL